LVKQRLLKKKTSPIFEIAVVPISLFKRGLFTKPALQIIAKFSFKFVLLLAIENLCSSFYLLLCFLETLELIVGYFVE